jgi:hypothetical protein
MTAGDVRVRATKGKGDIERALIRGVPIYEDAP